MTAVSVPQAAGVVLLSAPAGCGRLRGLCRLPDERADSGPWWVELDFVPQVHRAMFRESLSRLSADGGAVFLPRWWFGLRRPSTGTCRG